MGVSKGLLYDGFFSFAVVRQLIYFIGGYTQKIDLI